jgi:hypothetical protein
LLLDGFNDTPHSIQYELGLPRVLGRGIKESNLHEMLIVADFGKLADYSCKIHLFFTVSSPQVLKLLLNWLRDAGPSVGAFSRGSILD